MLWQLGSEVDAATGAAATAYVDGIVQRALAAEKRVKEMDNLWGSIISEVVGKGQSGQYGAVTAWVHAAIPLTEFASELVSWLLACSQ